MNPSQPSEQASERHDAFHRKLHHVGGPTLTPDTAQTPGMHRLAALSGSSVGSISLWMGETHVDPATASGNHHHGESETGIYVVRGHPEFVFLEAGDDGPVERRLRAAPGDYVYVPPWVPHREENPDPAEEAVVVIARTTQEAIVVNVVDLGWTGPAAT